jgi:hypothetical protein
MSEMNLEDGGLIAEAIAVWTGKGTATWPQVDDSRVMAHFGTEAGTQLLLALRKLYDEFYESDANLRADNLSEMAVLASAAFREKHPTAGTAIISALAWCYTFDFK